MEITLDLSAVPTENPIVLIWWFFKTIGWIYPVFLFCLALILYYQLWIRNNYRATRKYMLLAVDVPKENEQGPKAVENIFNQLAGAHQPLGFYEKWWHGEVPDSFSFEIVSLGGYIQFIIHFDAKYRDLIEAIIYAQYPDAEIVEIEDYTKDWDLRFPNEKYDLWGTELVQTKSQYYPIRLYEEFEDTEGYKDSMAGFLEALTRIGPGEQIWTQLVVTPADNDWGDKSENLIKKLSGAKVESKKNIFDYVFDVPNMIISEIFSSGAPATETHKKDEPYNLMMHLTQGEKDTISAIEKKVGKIGFHTRIRILYFAEKARFNKPVTKAIYGAYKQFNTLDWNGLKPLSKTLTAGLVWFKNYRLNIRKRKIFYRYKWRGHWLEPDNFIGPGNFGKIFNSEELASMYHFPMLTVKTPLLKKTEAKKAEPPMSLPINNGPSGIVQKDLSPKSGPPENLPIG
ncbi:MAG: hypothetical protein WCW26_03995 [Candidatus Buchananbacteria bacterium]